MYFNRKNNFYHGIMFHHFHDDKLHKRGQGSINKDDFYKLIKFIGRRNIIGAGPDISADPEGKYPIRWKTPLAIGTAMGAAQAAMPKDVIPTDTSGYEGGVGGIQRTARITPEALAARKGLHFVPQDVARLRSPAEEQAILGAAEGGRIGYNDGGLTDYQIFSLGSRSSSGLAVLGLDFFSNR